MELLCLGTGGGITGMVNAINKCVNQSILISSAFVLKLLHVYTVCGCFACVSVRMFV